jgi:hypothetical protein
MKKSFFKPFAFNSILVKNYDTKLHALAHAKYHSG